LRHLINWLLSALAVWVVSRCISLGVLLKIVTFPLTILTLGLFWLVINALMLELASWLLSPAFRIDTFGAAFWGAIVLSLVNMLFRWLAGTGRKDS